MSHVNLWENCISDNSMTTKKTPGQELFGLSKIIKPCREDGTDGVK